MLSRKESESDNLENQMHRIKLIGLPDNKKRPGKRKFMKKFSGDELEVKESEEKKQETLMKHVSEELEEEESEKRDIIGVMLITKVRIYPRNINDVETE